MHLLLHCCCCCCHHIRSVRAAVLDGTGSTKQRGLGEPGAPVALLSKSGREVYVAQQQSGKGFLLVYDLAGKQPGLLDLIKVSQLVGPALLGALCGEVPGQVWVPGCGRHYTCVAQRVG